VPAAPALYEPDLYNDPQFVENEVFVWQEHPYIGKSQLVGFPVECSNIENVMTSRAPLLGEQTAEILSELGYERAAIDKLKADKVVFF
jgi:crotonobetainyl-CoA:carnitine CoA-transferase CaiB-like acyl-CoA transferase